MRAIEVEIVELGDLIQDLVLEILYTSGRLERTS